MYEYDIERAFAAIEEELIASMMRNMQRHRDWEDDEGFNWSMWQAEQLEALEKYKKANKKKFQRRFNEINGSIRNVVEQARQQGGMEQELEILGAIQNGWKAPRKRNKSVQTSAEFFKLNTRKLEALIKATEHDFKKAETAMLRRANDQYRQVIFNAQVYANSGAGTYEKAVDMATKDFLAAGINCIEYKNGARHTMKDYADMAIRTASKRAYLTGEGEKRQEWGISTVIINKRGNPCPKCLPFVGKVMIDDVWSGGKRSEGPYPLMSSAIEAGLYHPNCKDSHSTYFPEITEVNGKFTKAEVEEVDASYTKEQKKQHAQRQVEKFEKLEKRSLDEDNQKRYAARRKEWKAREQRRRAELEKTVKESEGQLDRESLKAEISKLRSREELLAQQLDKMKESEKTLTQKVYFDENGTQEEFDKLKNISGQKKAIEKKIDTARDQILEKQSIYKSETERRLMDGGIVNKVKLSKRMTPVAADELENTLRSLKTKYDIMPEAVIFEPMKVDSMNAAAAYNWGENKIYLSARINDAEARSKIKQKSEESLKEYNHHHKIMENAKETIEWADDILLNKSIKGYEREKARIAKAEAEIKINITRMSVPETITDVLIHEYGHFIHRQASESGLYQKAFGMRELGGRMINGGWDFDINKKYSTTGKIEASKISRYAASDPIETFAEGFTAMEKGETIPESIRTVVEEAKMRAGVKPSKKIVSERRKK